MASYTFENHTFRMVDRTDGKDIKVPSNMYPLNREAQLFTTETTDTISDAHLREIVNCIDGRMNSTYQNAEQVVRTLNVYGIPAVQYVGWVFMSDSAPMYQSFALVKGDHGGPAIIDLSVDPIWPQWEQEMAQYTTPDEMRAAFIEKQSKRWDVPNTERCVFGQVPDYMVYVASMCTTDQGLKLYQKVMRAFPKHPANLEAEHAQRAKMLHNNSHKFESTFLSLQIPENNSVMFSSLSGSKLGIWVAHGEGKFSLPEAESQYNVVAKYNYAQYPGNPNGSDYNVAGICSNDGRHLAMMPHLERAIFPWQNAWYPADRRTDEVTPWIEAFVNARKWVEAKLGKYCDWFPDTRQQRIS